MPILKVVAKASILPL